MAVVPLQQLQRRDGGGVDRGDAGGRAHYGFLLAYSLATATFGGFTPAVCTWLIHTLDNRAAPGIWLSGAALLGLLATLVLFRRRGKEIAEAELANA